MKSLSTALGVLSLFAEPRDRWKVGEIAERLGLGRSHVFKILTDLRGAGFIEQDPRERTYAVAARSFALGSQYLAGNSLARNATGPMRRLADATGQTTTLCTLHDLDILHLVSIEGRQFLDVGWRVGTWVPFHATAVGKVLYAFAPAALLDRAIEIRGMPRLTDRTICDREELRAQLARVRQTGFSATFEETLAGLGALAVPIFGADQAVIGSLGIIYPVHTVDRRLSRELIEALHNAARSTSERMGAQVYRYGMATER